MIEMLSFLIRGRVTAFRYSIRSKDLTIECKSYVYYIRDGKNKNLSQLLKDKIVYD